MNTELEQHRESKPIPSPLEVPEQEVAEQHLYGDASGSTAERSTVAKETIPDTPSLPDIPSASDGFDLELAITSVVGVAPTDEEKKLHKRASNVLKLTEENEKLRAELKAMTDRLEAAERRKAALRQQRAEELRAREQEQHVLDTPPS